MFSEETVLFPDSNSTDTNPISYVQVPDLPGFKALESSLVAFRLSIPREYRDPFASKDVFERSGFRPAHSSYESSLDPILYALHILPAM